MSLTFVGAWAGHLFGGISKAFLGSAKCLDGGGPGLATGHEVRVVSVVFLGARKVFYAENVIWSPCKESSRVDPILRDSPAIDILDQIVRPWSDILPLHRVVENGATTLREPIAGRVEALVLLFLRYDVEGCVLGGNWICARSSERLKVILALHVELLLLFLVGVTRHHCHLLR